MAPRSRRQVFENIESISPEEYGDFAPDTLHQMAFMESSYGQHPSTGDVTKKFSGPFQMGVEQYSQHGDVAGNRMNTPYAGRATLKMGAANTANTGTWKEYGMDKRLGELGISKELSAYMTHQQGRSGLINLLTGITGGDRPAEHVEGAMGPHNLSTDISRYGGTKSAGGKFSNEEGTRKRLLSNLSAEEGVDFAGMDTKELAQNWVRQTKSKWAKAGENVSGLYEEFGSEVSSDFIGPLMPGQKRAEKKRGLEKPERPSLSDDDVFDSIATDELDIMPDEKVPSVLDESEIGGPEELKLRRATSEIGGGLDFVGEPVNSKGDALDNLMKVLSAPDNYKAAR